jgi:hypothetical protein
MFKFYVEQIHASVLKDTHTHFIYIYTHTHTYEPMTVNFFLYLELFAHSP